MNCGTILYDTQFQFPDGRIIDKLIIVLGDLGTDYLVAQTTRQQKFKKKVAGCQINDNPSNYFIPERTSWFNDDTWVVLNEVYEYNSDTFAYKKADKIVQHRNVLPKELIKHILECALKSDDIELLYLEYIKRAYDKL